MRALCWNGKKDVRVETVPDPSILNAKDVILRVTSTAICGSDLHLYDGVVKGLLPGDILGHEFMGEVVETGAEVRKLKVGDRVVIPFTIACGECFFCQHDLWSLCDNSNPNARLAEPLMGYSPSGLFGYTHLFGGFAGGQAEYVRVPYADVGALKVPDGMPDEQVLFLSDIFPTGYMAAENGDIQPGDTVAIWGCGPVGQFAIRSAFMLGAERVIAIDSHADRLEMAKKGGAETIPMNEMEVVETLKELTAGRGPDVCIDAVGMEAHGATLDQIVDRAKRLAMLTTDMGHVIREIIVACRKGGTISIAGVYAGVVDLFPLGVAFNKGLQMRMGQTHMHKYMPGLLERVQRGEIDPSFVITHRLPLEEAPHGYKIFQDRSDNCIKVVLKP